MRLRLALVSALAASVLLGVYVSGAAAASEPAPGGAFGGDQEASPQTIGRHSDDKPQRHAQDIEHRYDEAALHEVQTQIAPYCRKCRGYLADMQCCNNSAGDGNQDDRPPRPIRQFHIFFRCR